MILDSFLDGLQKKINSLEEPINKYELNKNDLLEIKNILYKYEIVGNQITLDNLLNFSLDDIRCILSIVFGERKDSFLRAYLVYKPLIDTYEAVKDKFGSEFEAPQYKDAVKWLNELVDNINKYIDKNNDNDYIDSLKLKEEVYRKYYNKFNGNSLIEVIDNFDELDLILNELNFNDEEKGKIKKIVGIGNIKLFNGGNVLDNNIFNKYKIILDDLLFNYKDTYELLKDRDIDFNNIDVDYLSVELNRSKKDIRGALSALWLESEFNNIEKESLDLDESLNRLDKIIDFSNVIDKEDDSNKLFIEASMILKNEQELINSIDEEKFNSYLAQSINSDTEEAVKYQIVSVLLALHGELNKYSNFKDDDMIKTDIANNISEYLEAYKVLKKKLDK